MQMFKLFEVEIKQIKDREEKYVEEEEKKGESGVYRKS